MRRAALLLLFVSALSLAAGCVGGGGGGRDQASRGGARNLDSLSPEESMRRDLDLLREEEATQLRRLDDLRRRGEERSDLAMREEERLRDIRARMNRYDEALQRGRNESRPYPTREYASVAPVAPARVMEAPARGQSAYAPDNYGDPYAGNAYGNNAYAGNASAGPNYPSLPTDYRREGPTRASFQTASYSPQGGQGMQGGQGYGGLDVREGERLVYAPPQLGGGYTDPSFGAAVPMEAAQPSLPERRVITEPGSVPPAYNPNGKFGGATMGRPNYPRVPTLREERMPEERNRPENQFADRSVPARTDYPGLDAGSEEKVVWPESTPAQASRNTSPPRLSAAPVQTRAQLSAPAPLPSAPVDEGDYGIFVPDLYLSGK